MYKIRFPTKNFVGACLYLPLKFLDRLRPLRASKVQNSSRYMHFEVELLKNNVSRKTPLKFLKLSASNVNKVVTVTNWVHISLHRTETEGRIELRFVTFERAGLPLSEMLQIAKTIFLTRLRKNCCIFETKTSKVGPF